MSMSFLLNVNGLFYIAGYLIGAIPFGYLLGRLVGKVDVRSSGSGSIGATNVLRVLKERDPKLAKKLAIATFACDALKGPAVMCAAMFAGCDANVLGTIMLMLPIEALLGLAMWFLVGLKLKISSIASLAGMLTTVISSFFIHPELPVVQTHAPVVIIGFVIFYKHIPNIVRLFKKEEAAVV